MQSNGRSYEARFDGREYPVQADAQRTTVTVRRIDPHTVLETRRRAGEVTEEIRLVVSADGATLTITERDLRRATVVALSYARQ
jgi:hypothetical protein